ncbi:MAG: DUF1223 domain-containing protein [Proteobacteria bacterium]|nr:DUF1223 domain-containing protein [Pseudomonadota bacterium]MBI3495700.1 DUF1223 domain-containing protein [Pseudomonadota bacterium]
MTTRRLILSLAPVLVGLGLMSAAAETRAPVVLELFTSQGCDSCPPADAYLGELAKRPDAIALAFHVDYWDYIGWKDPYALADATKRQRDYGGALGARVIYTPQLVIQGAVHEVGSDRGAVARSIAAALRPTVSVRLKREADALKLEIGAGSGPGEVWLVGYDPKHETKVPRGENAGKTLVEYNIVRGFRRVATWSGAALSLDLPVGELPLGSAYAALLQVPGPGPILGAASLPALAE